MSNEIDMSRCRPIPGDVWNTVRNGELYHLYAMKKIEQRVDFANVTGRLPIWSTEFVKTALIVALTKQEDRNYRVLSIDRPPVKDDRWQAMLDAEAYPEQLLSLRKHLGKRAAGIGMEIARHTHIGIWDTEDMIDAPVRRSLVNNRRLQTFLVEGQPLYKMKDSHDNGRIIERKRLIMTHYGDPYKHSEKLWTVRRDLYLADCKQIHDQLHDEPMPNCETREMNQARNLMVSIANNGNVNQNNRIGDLNDAFEPLIDQPIDTRPKYLYPLLTTMYLREPTGNVPTLKQPTSDIIDV